MPADQGVEVILCHLGTGLIIAPAGGRSARIRPRRPGRPPRGFPLRCCCASGGLDDIDETTAWCTLWLLILDPRHCRGRAGCGDGPHVQEGDADVPLLRPRSNPRRRPDLSLLPVRRLHRHAGGQGMDGRRVGKRIPSRHRVSRDRREDLERGREVDRAVVHLRQPRREVPRHRDAGAVDQRRHRTRITASSATRPTAPRRWTTRRARETSARGSSSACSTC